MVNQQYDPEVQNPAAFIGSNVLMKCNIPTFVKDYVSVISWLQEPSFNIYPATESGKYRIQMFDSPVLPSPVVTDCKSLFNLRNSRECMHLGETRQVSKGRKCDRLCHHSHAFRLFSFELK